MTPSVGPPFPVVTQEKLSGVREAVGRCFLEYRSALTLKYVKTAPTPFDPSITFRGLYPWEMTRNTPRSIATAFHTLAPAGVRVRQPGFEFSLPLLPRRVTLGKPRNLSEPPSPRL